MLWSDLRNKTGDRVQILAHHVDQISRYLEKIVWANVKSFIIFSAIMKLFPAGGTLFWNMKLSSAPGILIGIAQQWDMKMSSANDFQIDRSIHAYESLQ